MATLFEFLQVNRTLETILQRVLHHAIPTPAEIRSLMAEHHADSPNQAAPKIAMEWLGLLNLAVTPHLLRTYVLENNLDDSELRSIIRFLIAKKGHTQEDRDKVDWLTTHLFKMRNERTKGPTAWPKADVMEIVSGMDFPGLSKKSEELLMEMPALLDEVKFFRTFSQITDSHIIHRARDMKNQFGEEFFYPDVLTAIVNYNLFFGKQFHDLFQDSIRQVQEFANSDPNRATPDEKGLLTRDYRLTSEAFSNLGNLSRQEAVDGFAQGNLASQQPSLDQQLKQLGVDAEQENLYLRNRIEELLMRVRGNPNMTTIPNSFAPLMLDEWEVAAMRNPFPDTEQSFRSDFGRGITRAITVIYRIYEEIPQFLEKKGTEFLWKRHYDSLVYLLYEGRNHKETLIQLAISSAGRGLNEKAKQLQATAHKLDASLAKVAELF